MVGPQDGGFGFDQSKKYTSVDNLEKVCVQCQAEFYFLTPAWQGSKQKHFCGVEQALIPEGGKLFS